MEYFFRQKDVYDDSSVSVRFQEEGIVGIVTKFREFLLGAGFHINNVDEYVPDPYNTGDVDGDYNNDVVDFPDKDSIPEFLRKDAE